MVTSSEYLSQVNKNLSFLGEVGLKTEGYLDWQITICFYVSVHLINFHLHEHNFEANTHIATERAINPFGNKPTSLPIDVYDGYKLLSDLSRWSRYLKIPSGYRSAYSLDDPNYLKEEFVESIEQLDILLSYFGKEYGLSFPTINLKLPLDSSVKLSYFKVIT